MQEIWEDIKGYEGYYQYSSFLRFRSLDRNIIDINGVVRPLKGGIMTPWQVQGFYPTISFCKKGKYVKVLVHVFFAKAFIPNPNNYKVVNHKDGNKSNYSLDNLEWVTKSEDALHAYRTGLRKRKFGKDNPNFGRTGSLHPLFGRRGKGIGMYGRFGKEHHNSKLVLDTQTGIFYDSAKEAASAKCISVSYLRMQMTGNCKNKTSLIYA